MVGVGENQAEICGQFLLGPFTTSSGIFSSVKIQRHFCVQRIPLGQQEGEMMEYGNMEM